MHISTNREPTSSCALLTSYLQHTSSWVCGWHQPWAAGFQAGSHQQSQQQLALHVPHSAHHHTKQLQWPQCSSISSNSARHLWSSTAASSSDASSSNSDSSSSEGGTPAARPRDMAIVFTCGKCDTRAVKAFTRQAYEGGLVLITCPGCQSMHLIADHLGWFGDSAFKIDEYMAAQGQAVKRVSINTPGAAAEQLTAEDMAGWSKVQQLLSSVASASSSQSEQQRGGCSGAGHDHSSRDPGSASSTSSHPVTERSAAQCSDAASASAPSSSSSSSSSEQSAAELIREGVVDVAPADVEAWMKVQQQKQQQ